MFDLMSTNVFDLMCLISVGNLKSTTEWPETGQFLFQIQEIANSSCLYLPSTMTSPRYTEFLTCKGEASQ